MCGILGTNFAVSESQFETALDSIAHRGPDDRGVYHDDLIRLGHQRLAILDLSANGHQPMSVLDGKVWIVFNGEIYNHLEIRKKLRPDIAYKSTSDTETILYAYLEFGPDVVNLLNGIFTFAIYDQRSNQLFVARDQLGIKPLYYYVHDGQLAFSSELKAIAGLPGIDREIDIEALADYIHFLWSPGQNTPFRHVKKLLPGHYFTMDLSSRTDPVFTKYYELPFDGSRSRRSEEQLIDELDERICTAVKRQLLSDVPVGFFLSGGLDSSLIVAVARKLTGSSFNTYTISMEEDSFDGFVDDLSYAQKVAEFLDVKLIRVEGSPDILRDFDEMIWHLDEPQADPSPLHVWNICRYAIENGDKVLLGGTAGDDLFSGYRRHQALNYERWFRLLPGMAGSIAHRLISALPSNSASVRRAKKLAAGLGKTRLERIANYYSWLDVARIKGLFKQEHADRIAAYQPLDRSTKSLDAIPGENEPLNQMLFWDLNFFLTDHNLNYTDKMSMATGVEVRVPFLDMELVEFACKLPTQLKMNGSTTKYLLKKVAERYLPHDVIYRPKVGFGAPVRQWVHDGLLDKKIKTLQSRSTLFEPDAIARLLEDCKSGKLDGYYAIWSVLAIDSWMAQFTREMVPA